MSNTPKYDAFLAEPRIEKFGSVFVAGHDLHAIIDELASALALESFVRDGWAANAMQYATAEQRIIKAESEAAKLRKVIEDAPHDGDVCNRIIRDQYGRPVLRGGICTCWKSKAPVS